MGFWGFGAQTFTGFNCANDPRQQCRSTAGFTDARTHHKRPITAGHAHASSGSKRMDRSSQGARVIGALVEIRSTPLAA